MKLKPLYDRIIVRQHKAEEVSKGGIILPDQAQEKPMLGTVEAVGNGKLQDSGEVVALQVKPGDVVMFGKYSGTEVKIDGVGYLVMRESELLGVME